MNATSSFTKINPNNETFESNIEELLRVNGFHLKAHKDQITSETPSEGYTRTSNQNHQLDNEIEEVHLQVRSRSASRLRGPNISENTTVLKVYSKTTLQENELTNKLSNTETSVQKKATLSGGNEVPEEYDKMKDKLRNSYGRTGEKCVSDDDKMTGQMPVRETRNINRIIEDPEVIEIYFSKKDVDSDRELLTRTFSKKDNECCASKSGDSVSLSGTNDRTYTIQNVEHAKSGSLNENRFVEPTRDWQDSVDCKFEKNRRDLNECPTLENKNEVNDSETSGEVFKGKVDEKIELDMKENSCHKLRTKNEDSTVIDEVPLKDLSDEKNVNGNERNCNTENNLNFAKNLRCLKSENFENSPKAKDLVEDCETVKKCDGEKSNTKIDCHRIENMNFSVFEDTLLTRAKENQNVCLNSTFIKTDKTVKNVKSNESEVSKSSLNSEGSEDLSSVENTTVIANEEKSSVNSLKENKIKVVIEKREKKDNIDRDVFDDVKINLSAKNVCPLIIDDKKKIQDSQHEIAKTAVVDSKVGITQKMIEVSDYEQMDICKMLTSIHEQLTYDLKRIKDIEAKLQGKVSASSNNYTMPLQLLDKTVARCKSYIHGSNNSQKAQSEIAKILSTFGEQLMVAVHKNTVVLNDQELRVNQMPFHSQNVNDRRNILKEINSSWNYWKPEIVYLIETISGLVKIVMDKNEEKENVKDPRKYKSVSRHVTNNLLVYHLKSRHKNDRLKPAKPNLFRKESTIETQISVATNLQQTKSKTSVKLLNVVNREKERIQNDLRISEKKTIDKSRIKKESNKNKNHGVTNQQPVWKPGGIVKIPSSNSATTLLKIRPNVKEKTNLISEHTKAEKPNKAVSASKKKVNDDFSSIKSILSSMRTTLTTNTNNTKIVGKRSNTSLRTSPRMKPRPGTLRATPRICNEPVRQITKHSISKHSESRTSHDDAQKRSKESKPLSTLKETNGREDVKNITNRQFYDKINQVTLDARSETILIKKETGNSKEEPTRDDSSRLLENLRKFNDTFHENQMAETDKALDLSKKRTNIVDEEMKPNFDKHRSKGSPGSVVSMNCMTDFGSKYECTAGFDVASCQTSFNSVSSSTQNAEQKNEERELDKEMENAAKKNRTNSHALSLNRLKQFLCEQGIDADLVNRAERELKDKQRAGRYSKKKSISFADMFFSVRDDQRLQKALKNEHLWDMLEGKEENDVNCGNNSEEMDHKDDVIGRESLKCAENVSNCKTNSKHMENAIDCEKNLKYIECHEENGVKCEESLKYIECHKENDISCEKSLKYTDCRKENDINCEKSSKQDGIDCDRNLKHTKTYIADVADCEANLECTENFVNHEKNLKHTKNYKGNVDCERYTTSEELKGNVMSCENNSKYIESHEENVISERRLKHVENVINYDKDAKDSENKENHISFQKNSRRTEIYNDNDINCDKSLRYIETYEENDINSEVYENNIINCESSLMNVACQKENDSNYEDRLRFPREHIEIDISPERNLRHAENNSLCKRSLKHTENYKENNSTCGSSTKHTENYREGSIHCDRDLEQIKNHKESQNNCVSSLKNIENDKGNRINCERNLNPTGSLKGSSNCDNRIEKDNYFKERLKHTENNSNNNNNCTSSKYSENHREIDIDREHNLRDTEYHKEGNITYNISLSHAGNRKGNGINCSCSLDCAENYIEKCSNCDRSLNYEKNYKGSNINCSSSLKYVGNHKENNIDSDSILNCAKNNNESNINFDSTVNCGENNNESNINCDSTLKYTKDRKDSNMNSDRNLRFEENKVSNINCDNSLEYTENHKESNVNCDNALNQSEYHKHSSNCESSLKYTKNNRRIDINHEYTSKYVESTKGNDLVENFSNVENCKENNCCDKNMSRKKHLIDSNKFNPPAEGYEIVNYGRSSEKCSPQMKDAASCTENSNKDVYSQTNFYVKDLKTLQTILLNNIPSKKLRVTETQTEIYCMRNINRKGKNASSMTVALPINDTSTETITVSSVSTSMATEQIDCVFSNRFNKKNLKKETCKSSKAIETFDEENSSKKCDNFFRQLLNQMQEHSFEKNDASNELRFVESNASTSTSASSPEREKVMKHAHTSPIKVISYETMAAFHVTAIRIHNIYKAIGIYNRKLRNDMKAEKRSKRVNKICKEKPSCVSKSSSVDSIFTRKNESDQNGIVQIFEALRQVESTSDVSENEQDDSESIKSSLTTWSYESTCGKVELKISGKLSDTIVLKDVGHLIEFLVQKTEDSMGKADLVQKISENSNSACRFQNTETTRFAIFSRENLLPLVYAVVCSVVFCCLHFTITCDTVL